MTTRRSTAAADGAEALALEALVFLTEDETRLSRFLTETGMSPAELGRAAGQGGTLSAVLDHLLADESLLMVFAAGGGHDPAAVAAARAVIEGASAGSIEEGYGIGGVNRAAAVRKPSKRWPGP